MSGPAPDAAARRLGFRILGPLKAHREWMVVEVGPREHLALLALRVKRRSPSIRPIQRADAVTGWIQAQAEARTLLGAMGVDPELALAPAPEQFLGGGVGILGREYGPTLDHVVGVQIVRVVGARPLSARTSGLRWAARLCRPVGVAW